MYSSVAKGWNTMKTKEGKEERKTEWGRGTQRHNEKAARKLKKKVDI